MTAYTMTITGIGSVSAERIVIQRVNRAANTCTISEMRIGSQTSPIGASAYYTRGNALCLVGKWITCYYGAAVIFSGIINTASRKSNRGTTISNTIEAKSGWFFLEQIPYVQNWVAVTTGATETAVIKSTRVVLNQNATGLAISAWAQIDDILTCAKAIYSNGLTAWIDETANATGSRTKLDSVSLPYDELRDTTCAQALERVLRFFPDVSVSFNDLTKTMSFRPVGLHDALEYVDDYEKQLERNDSISGNVIDGVRLEVESTGTIDGKSYTNIDIQGAGETTGIHILNGTLEVSGRDSNRTKQRVDVVTEDFGDPSGAAWWKSKCPQVFGNAAVGDITITTHTRSGQATAGNYPRITSTPITDIAAAGLLARVETITCVAKVVRKDAAGTIVDTENNLPVQIELITTNATTRSYTFTTSLSATSAEPVPDDLAAALLAAHAGDGVALSVLAKLPDTTADFNMSDASAHSWLPEPGDSYGGMIAQSVKIDFPSRTMSVDFGPPSHLSIQDMVGMMTGFKTRKTTSLSGKNRATGEVDSDEINMNMAVPAKSIQSGKGSRERFVVKKESAGTIDADPSLVTDSDNEVKPRQITVYIPGESGTLQPRKIWVMGSEGVDDGSPVSTGGGIPNGTVIPGRVIYSTSTPIQFAQYTLTWNAATNVWVESATPTTITTLDSHVAQHY